MTNTSPPKTAFGPAVWLALLAVTPAARADDLDDAVAIIERLEAETASVSFDDLPIARVIDDLSDLAPVPVRADWSALERIGVSPRDVVRLQLDDAPLWTILGGVALQVGDDFERARFEAWAGQIVLTTSQASAVMRVTAVYDARDLIAAGAAARVRAGADEPAPAGDEARPAGAAAGEEGGGAEGGRGGDGGGGAGGRGGDGGGVEGGRGGDGGGAGDPEGAEGDAPRRFEMQPPEDLLDRARVAGPRTPGEELMALLVEHVEPEAWIRYGGHRATISERDGVFIVTAPPTMHLRLRRALDTLRSAFFTTVTVDAAIVDVPRATFDRLARRYGLSTGAFARTLLAAEDAEVRWRAAAAAAMERRMEIESRGGGTSVTLRIEPAFDRERGTLTLAVAAETVMGEDRRRVDTVVTIPVRTGAVTLELAPAAPADTVRMLIVLPQPG